MSKKKKSPWSANKHERILQKCAAYGDGFRPRTIREFLENPRSYLCVKEEYLDSAFIMRLDILYSFGGTSQNSWSERDADERREEEGRKPASATGEPHAEGEGK